MSEKPPERVHDLLDAIETPLHWHKLPFAVMREAGPAVQTLSGLLEITHEETFVAIEKIAYKANVPVRTAQKHLDTLESQGWIKNHGRQKTKKGYARRTCTMSITDKTAESLSRYGALPWWAGCTRTIRGRKKSTFPWATRALLSVLVAKLMALKNTAIQQYKAGSLNRADLWEIINDWCANGNHSFQYGVEQLGQLTGLSRVSIIAAKRHLAKDGIIIWQRDQRDDGGSEKDILMPNMWFRVKQTSAGNGTCTLDFENLRKRPR